MKIIQKNQFMKIVGICLFTFMGTICMTGQSYNQSLLLNKEWENRIPGKTYVTTCLFTSTEWIVKDFINNGVKTEVGLKTPYYLSDEIVDQFQQDCVGKSKSGKYIVMLTKPMIGEEYVEMLEVHEILELTENTLKTKHLRSGTVLEYDVK